MAPFVLCLVFGFDAVWAVSSEGKVLERIDPATNAVTGSAALGDTPAFLAAGEGAV